MTMHFLHRMCGLCLTSSLHLTNLFSTDQDGLTHYDKIASSLSKLANKVEMVNELLLCHDCSEMIDKIYNFNETSIKNIDVHKNILQGQDLECYVRVKLEKNEVINLQPVDTVAINVGNAISFHAQNNDVCSTNFRVSESETIQEIFIKTEIDDPVEKNFDNNDKYDVEEKGLNNKCFRENSEKLMKGTEASISSKVEVIQEYFTSQTDDVTNINQEELKEKEKKMGNFLTAVEEKLHKCGLNVQDQIVFGNKTKRKNKIYNCSECSKTFTQKCNLINHFRIHTGAKPFSCFVCKKSFNTKGNLKTHMLIHSGEKPYPCNACKKVFSQKAHLDLHKLIHSGVKPFLCDVCDKSFTQKINLATHKLTHSGEKPYACDFCDKTFVRKTNLIEHRHVHTGEKPYSCDICSESFAQKRSLRYHRPVHKH